MMNVVSAKEKAKALLRKRSIADAAGFGSILAALFLTSGAGLLWVWIASVYATFSSPLPIPSYYRTLVMLVAVLFLGVGILVMGAALLFHGGMVRASLRMIRRRSNVRVLDIVLAGDRMKHTACVTLWIMFYLILWNLIGDLVMGLGVYLVISGFLGRLPMGRYRSFLVNLPVKVFRSMEMKKSESAGIQSARILYLAR